MHCEAVIGLELHIQLATRTKIFCSCPAVFGSKPNTHTCPVCLGLPGAMPVLNRSAVEMAIITARATGCRIVPISSFARKQYFYPDLPKGYQITQYELPLAVEGFFEIDLPFGGKKRIGIIRMHLEEDAGKLVHERSGQQSSVDYNRAGVPLLEVVSDPGLRTPEEAGAYLRGLHTLVQYLGVCDGNMEQGSFRFDANVSIRPHGSSQTGSKVELKNLNSFRHVERALAHEVERQTGLVSNGSRVISETRLWDDAREQSVRMREKEKVSDYRYVPEPDLPHLEIDSEWIARLVEKLPELPQDKKKRLIDSYGLSEYDASFLTQHRQTADYFEETVARGAGPKQACNWIMGEVSRALDDIRTVQEFVVTPGRLAELICLIEAGKINKKIAKAVFDKMIVTDQNPIDIVSNEGLFQITSSDELEAFVTQMLERYPDEVASFRAGKKGLLDFFVGRVMKLSEGMADPVHVKQILRSKFDE